MQQEPQQLDASLKATMTEKNPLSNNTGFSIRDYFETCGHYWYWFLISLVVCVGYAYVNTKSQTQQFRAYARILIKGNESSSQNMMFSDRFFRSSQSTNNAIYVLRSSALLEQVVKRLGIDVTYYSKPFLREVNIYKKCPIEIKFFNAIPRNGFSMEVQLTEDGKYIFRYAGEDDDSWKKAEFGKRVSTSQGVFVCNKTPLYGMADMPNSIRVRVNNSRKMATDMWDSVIIKSVDTSTNVLELSYQCDSYQMACDIIDNLIDAYNQDAINDKNRVALNTEAFIVERIASLGSELKSKDKEVSTLQMESGHGSVDGAASYNVGKDVGAQETITEIDNQLTMIDFLKKYLYNNITKEALIPSNIGVDDAGLGGVISSYNQVVAELQKVLQGATEESPQVKELRTQLTVLRNNLMISIDNYANGLRIKRSFAETQENLAKTRISTIPDEVTAFSEVMREQNIKQSLYMYLLNKREENALQLAVTEPSAKIVERAGGSEYAIYPVSRTILMTGFGVGVAIPAVIIYLLFWIESMDTKIYSRADVENYLTVPILGEIPKKKKSQEGQEIICTETGKDRVSEAMRMVRSNFGYFVDDSKQHGIIVQMTSTAPGEGKSYVAINLALSFAQMGKKVIAVDFDLRKGKFTKMVGAKGHRGVSGFLAGRVENLDDIVISGDFHPNLDILPLGSIPPNPANLIMSPRFDLLIEKLKERYDYIFLDTVPYNVIADAALINRCADMTIYVIRAKMIDRRYLPTIERLYTEGKANNMSVLITDVNTKSRRYSYGYGYGYGAGYGYGYSYNYGSGYGYIDGDEQSMSSEK